VNDGPSIHELIPTHASSLLAAVCLLAVLVITTTDPSPKVSKVVEQAPPMINVGELGAIATTSDVVSYSRNEAVGCSVDGSPTELVCADAKATDTSTIDL